MLIDLVAPTPASESLWRAMFIPSYWAESRQHGRRKGRRVTVRRFGFSDESPEAAQRHADERAREALAQLLAGGDVPRRELRRAYGGTDGMPIREEIVARHGEVVITRNSYGARCLNVRDAFFVDVDLDDGPPPRPSVVLNALLGAVVGALAFWRFGAVVGALALFAALVTSSAIFEVLFRVGQRLRGGAAELALARIRRFAKAHPAWRMRVYRTPAGFRVLVVHRTFDPLEPAVAECFRALGADPAYVRMCLAQRCFRARISPKPWRIGEVNLSKRTRAVWPVTPQTAEVRAAWIEHYEKSAGKFASCAFVEELGDAFADASVERVRQIHDDACRANSSLPLA